MIQKYILLTVLGIALFSLTGCKKEKHTHDIITKIAPKPKLPKGPIELQGFTYTKKIDWLGTQYIITIIRKADKGLPLAYDEDGKKYYDNKIIINIKREDGTKFYQKEFTKKDFIQFSNEQYGKNGALLGFMFDSVYLKTLRFGASIGSPAPSSDEYIPIDIVIDNLGHLSMTKAQTLDTDGDQQKDKNNSKATEKAKDTEEDGV
ncbi:DUF4738 domain-containing protein [Prevotella amnii]|jgi:hypothetical protein|uniref:DUF4738 domain-containing protein n=1 Tax=Prevotella amnii TaxID=419005 RepID=UPI00037E9AF8|nr:DUF4738 domain-containing protein [Prevotella amnii]